MNPIVRQFIVQERYNECEWLDDPDQPADYTHGLEQAKWWMDNDNKSCRGHETTYAHRIIERTETQVWPNNGSSGPTVAEAWLIIDKLLVGMLISDPRWKPASNWLAKHRQTETPNSGVRHEPAAPVGE